MGFIVNDNIVLETRLTNYGRRKIAAGNFNIKYFQIGDSERNYSIDTVSRGISCMDKDSSVKYPYLMDGTGSTTYGTPIPHPSIDTITQEIGYAGCVSGTTTPKITTKKEHVQYTNISTNSITVSNGVNYEIGLTITILPKKLVNDVISVNSYTYKITGITGNMLKLNRNVPDFGTFGIGSEATIINNDVLENSYQSYLPNEQQDAWNLNVVWSKNPLGTSFQTSDLNNLYSNKLYSSVKEYFGYNTSLGQISNTGTTITNSFGDSIIVPPEDQRCIAVIHYSKIGLGTNTNKQYKYDDYISGETNTFSIRLPFILYENNSGSTEIGCTLKMSGVTKYIDSTAIGSLAHGISYHDLVDSSGHYVGKVFVNHGIIIIDDQELVAVLEQNSNRNYTLPIPRIELVPRDIKCQPTTFPPLLTGNTTDYTYYVTYMLENTGNTATNSLPCNHILKITGTTIESDISIKFGTNSFKHMSELSSDFGTKYIANKFYILYQRCTGSNLPTSTSWSKFDYTDDIYDFSGYTHNGENIDPRDLKGTRFIITGNELLSPNVNYVWSGNTNFSMDTVLPGSVKVIRATDIHVLGFDVILPSNQFTTSQNPSGVGGKISEIHLLDENYKSLVVSKSKTPIERTSTQTIKIKLDI